MNSEYEQVSKKVYDREFRANLIRDPQKYYQELSYNFDDVDIVVKRNTKDITYLVLTDPGNDVIDLSHIQAGGAAASTAGTVGSVSSFGSLTTCVGSLGCAGTLGSAGSAD